MLGATQVMPSIVVVGSSWDQTIARTPSSRGLSLGRGTTTVISSVSISDGTSTHINFSAVSCPNTSGFEQRDCAIRQRWSVSALMRISLVRVDSKNSAERLFNDRWTSMEHCLTSIMMSP